MRLTVRMFGLDLLDVELSTDSESECDAMTDLSGGTTYSTPIGFVPSHGDARWEPGVDYQ